MKPKKSLGQHFLTSSSIAKTAVLALNIEPNNDTVLEIGPGEGVLTEFLLDSAKKVVAVEKDHELIQKLQTRFQKEVQNGKLDLVYSDILTFSPKKLKKYKVIGNIPYYITGKILEKFLSEEKQPETMVFMVQREVAERIMAKNKRGSILSISVKAYGNPQIVRRVAPGSFNPPPSVESAIIKISSISKDFFKKIPEKDFFFVVKRGFAHKRKILIKNLSIFEKKEKLLEIFNKLELSPLIRAENITLSEWGRLAQSLKKLREPEL